MTVTLSVDEARSLAERCLPTAGYSAADSAIIKDPLIDCELRGVTSGGLPRLLSAALMTGRAAAPGPADTVAA
jgi:LDH2 family malate/lactate/ureidoglycolate dehydrogenase